MGVPSSGHSQRIMKANQALLLPLVLVLAACSSPTPSTDDAESDDPAASPLSSYGGRQDNTELRRSVAGRDAAAEAAPTTEIGCGTRGAGPCPEGLVCVFPIGSQCGETDRGGSCHDLRVVRCSNGGPSVCGCDGATYTNECVANVAGTSVRSAGACGS